MTNGRDRTGSLYEPVGAALPGRLAPVDRVQPGQLLLREPERAGGDVLGQVVRIPRAGDGEDVRPLVQGPGEPDLGGGGVVGAGVALDAVTRGLNTGLLEQRDLASGTSSRSSKLIHGGLRYLEMLDFALVREVIAERGLLLTRLAPHLVRPVPFLYPLTHRGWERAYVGTGLAKTCRVICFVCVTPLREYANAALFASTNWNVATPTWVGTTLAGSITPALNRSV